MVATSSGEAEFYALTKSASRALGAVALAADVAKVAKPRVRVDATASKAIASRRGVRRVRHLHTQVLWVQEAMARRELTIAKVPGCENPADLGTKHLAQRDDARMHEKSRLPHSGRTFKVGVEGRKGVRLEPATLRATETIGREHRLRLTRGREHRVEIDDRLRYIANDSNYIETKLRNQTARIQSTPC